MCWYFVGVLTACDIFYYYHDHHFCYYYYHCCCYCYYYYYCYNNYYYSTVLGISTANFEPIILPSKKNQWKSVEM